MADNISFIEEAGKNVAQAAYANQPGWHRLGTVFEPGKNKGMDSRTAVKLSRTDTEVEKQRLYLKNGQMLEDNYALVRKDTGNVLWVVGNDYQIHQNIEAFNWLDSLVMDGIMRYEAAFALKGGRGLVLLARMPSLDKGDFQKGDEIVKGDEFGRYILFSHWHGGGAIDILPTGIRVQCYNMWRLALSLAKYKVTIQHSGDLAEKLRRAKNYISQFDKGFTNYRESARKLLKGYKNEQVTAYINELFPEPEKKVIGTKKDGTPKISRAVAIRERKLEELRKAFKSPANTMKGVKGTWWAVYNAVTEAVDHGKLFSESKDERDRLENRFLSVSDGEGAKLKDRAFELALDMAA